MSIEVLVSHATVALIVGFKRNPSSQKFQFTTTSLQVVQDVLNTVQKKMPGFNQNVGVNFGGLFCCFALEQLVVFRKFV